jgi:hypothetical protein
MAEFKEPFEPAMTLEIPISSSGSLRIGSAKPASAAPSIPVNPWAGDVDEVLAFRGVMPSPDGGASSPSLDLVKWVTAAPPWTTQSSPCG